MSRLSHMVGLLRQPDISERARRRGQLLRYASHCRRAAQDFEASGEVASADACWRLARQAEIQALGDVE